MIIKKNFVKDIIKHQFFMIRVQIVGYLIIHYTNSIAGSIFWPRYSSIKHSKLLFLSCISISRNCYFGS